MDLIGRRLFDAVGPSWDIVVSLRRIPTEHGKIALICPAMEDDYDRTR
jgi:hypothetical protein